MSNRNILQALQSASGAGGAGLDVDEVFSTFLYDGGTNSNTIANGLDLDGEGGLVWIKNRDSNQNNWLLSEDLGSNHPLSSNFNTGTSSNVSSWFGSSPLYTFNNNGFTTAGMSQLQTSNNKYVSWSFRKAENFFDIVTYTGNGQTNRQISHNLGSVPGFMLVKRTDGIKDWAVYHRARGGTEYGTLNSTEAFYDNNTWWQDTAPTSTNFTVGNSAFTNGNGQTYVAYIWAHHDQNGTFGPDSDQDIIHCGSYDGNGSTTGPFININTGFEPQWLLIKSNNYSGSWFLFDVMRGIKTEGKDAIQYAESAYADEVGYEILDVNSNGFQLKYGGSNLNGSGGSYIYVAIKRGPLAVPDDATKVFHVNTRTIDNSKISTAFPADMSIQAATTFNGQDRFLEDRVRGFQTTQNSSSNNALLSTNTTGAENAGTVPTVFNVYNNSYSEGGQNASLGAVTWLWRRARGYFDIVAYSGTGSARTISHNLGVAPEMMWIKQRGQAEDWMVYSSALGNNQIQRLNSTVAAYQDSHFNNTTPTSTVFSVGTGNQTNGSGRTYIAYLFSTISGVSKVGSYTGNGSSGRVIDCGFSSGARFVLIKGTSASGYNWCVWDTARGIVSGNDPKLTLDSSSSQQTGYDFIDPSSSGFSVTAQADVNNSGVTYIFYAIA